MLNGPDIPRKLAELIQRYVAEYPHKNNCRSRWQTPLTAFARADDPLFAILAKEISGHYLPSDLLPEARSVVVYFIPFHKDIVRSNIFGEEVSSAWLWAYVETNRLIRDLNLFLQQRLQKENIRTKVLPATHNFKPDELISAWSHKHIGFIAGLGRFGLHQMLITKKGVCGRLGSIIIDILLNPTDRPEQEFCLERAGYLCAKCVRRCFTGALQKEGLDKFGCYERLLLNAKKFEGEGPADACGKCVCLIPCSFNNPVKNLQS